MSNKVQGFAKPSDCDRVWKAVEEGFQKVIDEAGLDLELRRHRGKYGPTYFKVEIEFAVRGDGRVYNADTDAYEQLATAFGLKKEWLWQEFIDVGCGERYTVVGLRPKAPKYPVLVRRAYDNGTFRFPADRVARSFEGTGSLN